MTQPTDDMDPQSSEVDESEKILEYVNVLRQRKWMIVSFALVGAGLAAGWSYTQTPIYQSSAQIMIERNDPKVISAQLQEDSGGSSPRVRMETHMKLMTSYPVLEEAVEQLNLSEQPEYQGLPKGLDKLILGIETPWIREGLQELVAFPNTMKKMVISAIKGEPKSNSRKSEQEGIGEGNEASNKKVPSSLVFSFKSRVSVAWIEDTKIVEVAVMSEKPKFAAFAANKLAQVYIDRNLEKKSQFSKFASGWFASELDNLRGKVQESEQILYAFRAKHGLVNLSSQQTVAAQRLAQQNLEMNSAEQQRTDAQTRYKRIEAIRAKVRSQAEGKPVDRSDLDSLSEVLDSSVIRGLRAREIESLVALANLSDKYGPLHPKMIKARTELQELKVRMTEEIDKVYGSVKNKYQLALAREKAVRKILQQKQQEKVALDKYAMQASLLEREAKSNREIYDLFLDQMSRTDLSTKIQTNNLYLAELALPKGRPIKPRTSVNTIFGLILGFVTGVGLVFFFEYGGKHIKGPRDLTRYFDGFLTIGMVPKYPQPRKSKFVNIMALEPLGVVANCYRHIRTSLWFAIENEPPFSLAITSPSDREGKSTLASNLAIALAQVDDVRVVLIDTDLRRPRLAGIFGLKIDDDKGKGLVHYLEGEAEESEILHETSVPNLALIPAGEMSSHPTELLHSKKMKALLQWCHQQGFSVILDTPAALPVVDALVVSNLVSGVILVVSAGETLKKEAMETVDKFMQHGIKILGVVMQKVSMKALPAYYRESPYFVSRGRKAS